MSEQEPKKKKKKRPNQSERNKVLKAMRDEIEGLKKSIKNNRPSNSSLNKHGKDFIVSRTNPFGNDKVGGWKNKVNYAPLPDGKTNKIIVATASWAMSAGDLGNPWFITHEPPSDDAAHGGLVAFEGGASSSSAVAATGIEQETLYNEIDELSAAMKNCVTWRCTGSAIKFQKTCIDTNAVGQLNPTHPTARARTTVSAYAARGSYVTASVEEPHGCLEGITVRSSAEGCEEQIDPIADPWDAAADNMKCRTAVWGDALGASCSGTWFAVAFYEFKMRSTTRGDLPVEAFDPMWARAIQLADNMQEFVTGGHSFKDIAKKLWKIAKTGFKIGKAVYEAVT